MNPEIRIEVLLGGEYEESHGQGRSLSLGASPPAIPPAIYLNEHAHNITHQTYIKRISRMPTFGQFDTRV